MHFVKHKAIRCFFVAAIFAMAPPQTMAADLGISLRIGQPGFYGEIHLGDFYPVPDLIYPEPVIIQRPSVYIGQQPIYLHVPPGHAKLWHRYCYQYNACNRPVYFIRERWYNDVYIPHYQRYNTHQHRYDNRQYYDSGKHYPDRRHDSHWHEDDRDYRDKYRQNDKGRRSGYDKHDRYDKHHKLDKHDRGRGRKHDD